MQKIAGVRCCGELSSLAPTHQTCPREDIGDRILLSMVVNAGFAARRDDEYAAPLGQTMPWLAEIAARRSDPGVCDVPASNACGETMLMPDCAFAVMSMPLVSIRL